MSPHKTDQNQKAIIQVLREVGASVTVTSGLGGGFPDCVVGFRGENYLLEIKNPLQPKHRHELTDDQKVWHEKWRGQKAIVFTLEDALRVIGVVNDIR